MAENKLKRWFPVCWKDTLICVGVLTVAMLLCLGLRSMGNSDVYAALVFETAVVIVARYTNGYFYGVLSSVIGVVGVNYMFTYPYFELNFSISGYPLTFLIMLTVAVIVGTMTTRLKQQEKLRMETEKEKMRSNLLRAVSHDLRTPLTSIIGATNAVLENETEFEQEIRKKLLQDVHDEAQWLLGVVENLLTVTRIGDQPASLNKDLEAAEEVVIASVQKFKKRFAEVQISVDIPDTLLMVPMDAILIQQVLINLMENAVIHGQTTSQIEIQLLQEQNQAVFLVADDGEGISRDAMPKLFEGYFTHEDHNKISGRRNMGIGLSVCLAIVKAHGGGMTAHNRKEGGAVFQFNLPLEAQ